jgi:hypothetical protein
MANTFSANGFSQYQGTGSLPTYEQTQLAISTSNATPIFFGDPVTQAAGTTGLGTGYVTQGYGPVTLTVAATAITTNATTGALTVTFTAATATSGNLPTSPNTWAPPVGSTLIIQGATMTSGNLNGTFTVTSSTTGTAVCANASTTINATSTASGTVTVVTPIAGIFVGCRYLSVSQKKPIWQNYWPGADANGDVTAYVITDPNAQFIVGTGNSNTTATPVGFANIGQNIGFHYSQSGLAGLTKGNVANGLSTMFADQYSLIANSAAGPAVNAFLPFRIIALANYVPGALSPLQSINGNDWTTAYNRIIVGFNNAMPRVFTGI